MISVDIFKRDKDANPVKLGTVAADGSPAHFEGFVGSDDIVKWLQGGIRVEDQTFTPDDGEAFVKALPYYLHGIRLWATLPKEG